MRPHADLGGVGEQRTRGVGDRGDAAVGHGHGPRPEVAAKELVPLGRVPVAGVRQRLRDGVGPPQVGLWDRNLVGDDVRGACVDVDDRAPLEQQRPAGADVRYGALQRRHDVVGAVESGCVPVIAHADLHAGRPARRVGSVRPPLDLDPEQLDVRGHDSSHKDERIAAMCARTQSLFARSSAAADHADHSIA